MNIPLSFTHAHNSREIIDAFWFEKSVGEAFMAIFWPTAGFEGKTFDSSRFSTEPTLKVIRPQYPLRVVSLTGWMVDRPVRWLVGGWLVSLSFSSYSRTVSGPTLQSQKRRRRKRLHCLQAISANFYTLSSAAGNIWISLKQTSNHTHGPCQRCPLSLNGMAGKQGSTSSHLVFKGAHTIFLIRTSVLLV